MSTVVHLADDERLLARAVREHHNSLRAPGGLRQLDRDRTDVARALDTTGMDHDEIADVIGVRPWQLPAVLRGERAPA